MHFDVKILIKTILKIILCVFFWLIVMEQLVRFYLFGFSSFNYFKMGSVNKLGVSGIIQPSVYPEIIYELKPNLDMYYKMVRFKTNPHGLRDKEYLVVKPKDTFRVAVLGDSFTMPTGVNIEDAFHSRLEDFLNSQSTAEFYEFINFGVGGYDVKQYLATLKYRALKYEPDLVLFCLCGPFDNGIQDEQYYHEAYKVKPVEHSFLKSFTLMLLNQNVLYKNFKLRLRRLFKRDRYIAESAGLARKTKGEIDYLKPIFLELSEISKGRNIPVCIVILSIRYIEEERYNEVKKLASENGLYLIDTIPYFKGLIPSDYFIYPINAHPNTKANKIFADVIYEFLKEHDLLHIRHAQ